MFLRTGHGCHNPRHSVRNDAECKQCHLARLYGARKATFLGRNESNALKHWRVKARLLGDLKDTSGPPGCCSPGIFSGKESLCIEPQRTLLASAIFTQTEPHGRYRSSFTHLNVTQKEGYSDNMRVAALV